MLLLVALRERAGHIEVGYGLEGILPDGMAGEIVRTEMLPEFRAGNMPRGIGRGLNRIAQIIRREAAAGRVEAPHPRTRDDRPPAAAVVPFFGIFVGLAAFVTGLGLRTKTFGPLLWSALFGAIPLVIATEFVSPAWIAGLLSFGLLMVPVGTLGLLARDLAQRQSGLRSREQRAAVGNGRHVRIIVGRCLRQRQGIVEQHLWWRLIGRRRRDWPLVNGMRVRDARATSAAAGRRP